MKTTYTAFAGNRLVAHGPLEEMVRGIKEHPRGAGDPMLLIFDDSTGKQIDFDPRESVETVVKRFSPVARGRGRPRMGVTGREITLLPRHWEWLDNQSQSASATIRRLIDAARKQDPTTTNDRRIVEAAGRFIWAIAGDFPDFEEASRALYARDWERLHRLIAPWPDDVRDHLIDLLKEIGEN